ncbi:chemotaxis response regulator protein-glutamate methylesterase [Paenalkalicoccus suaedae]|uniref:Protein-glutamate methylesterase/protein-glutamine glutaminase n=1 Tax=Paenalkalicoccus suaedae TaxID=2592382 RepID=A0A859FF03_9BACI|nr:chemotaxis response regulator protein-glutamate methylesterase [Paenalkalicoccus suaedae]QKS71418.1 chemotaxis response regulator protein-glutamate methylesterase [Paenalkalicoccus suaedae]
MINVLVVDDSAFMRKMIGDMLDSEPDIHVVARARNGKDAVEKSLQYKPDVITMDVEMPIMSGLEALTHILKSHKIPVIMLSSLTKTGAETTIRAMELGAFDFIAKPSGSISLDIDKVKHELLDRVRIASKVPLSKLGKISVRSEPLQISATQAQAKPTHTIVAIGTSTGGPKALQTVLRQLPENFPFPIMIVQHMPKGFTKSLAERLNSLCEIGVKEAEDGEILKKGIAYIAPGGYHLKVRGVGTSVAIRLDQDELVSGHRPSVDAMFMSLADAKVKRVIAITMTGMGSDGKKGLIQLKESLHTIAIAESEQTCVVFGMPRAAISTQLVDEVADLDSIASTLMKHC